MVVRSHRELLWVTGGQLLAFAGGFAAIKILTVALGPDEYGRFALGLTFAGLCNTFVFGPLSQAVLRFLTICRERGELPAYYKVLDRLYGLAAALVIVLSSIAAVTLLLRAQSALARLVLAACSFGIVSGINGYLVALLTGARRRGAAAAAQACDAWLKPLIAAAFLPWAAHSADAALLGFCTATALVTLGTALTPWSRRTPAGSVPAPPAATDAAAHAPANAAAHFGSSTMHATTAAQARGRLRAEMLRYAAPFLGFAGFGAISSFADRWIVLGSGSERDLGIYAALSQIANVPFLIVAAVVTQLVVPVLFQRAGAAINPDAVERSDRLLARTVVLCAACMLGIVAIAAIGAETVLTLASSSDFAQHHALLAPLCLGAAIFQLGQLCALKGMYHNSPGIYFWPKGVQAIALILLGWPLASAMGTRGMALAVILSSAAYLAAVLVANRRLPAVTPAVPHRPA